MHTFRVITLPYCYITAILIQTSLRYIQIFLFQFTHFHQYITFCQNEVKNSMTFMMISKTVNWVLYPRILGIWIIKSLLHLLASVKDQMMNTTSRTVYVYAKSELLFTILILQSLSLSHTARTNTIKCIIWLFYIQIYWIKV
jgi:hypothetical protein